MLGFSREKKQLKSKRKISPPQAGKFWGYFLSMDGGVGVPPENKKKNLLESLKKKKIGSMSATRKYKLIN